MKRLRYADGVRDRIAELRQAGAEFHSLALAERCLVAGRVLPAYFRDHDLKPPLGGYRSCIVGHTSDDNSIVAVYICSSRNVVVYVVDEHDRAYETLTDDD